VNPFAFPASRRSLLTAIAFALVGASACYRPSLTNGGSACSTMWDPVCPSGYDCVSGRCWLKGTKLDGAVVVPPPDAKVEVLPPDAMVDVKPDVPLVCIVPPTTCTPAAGPTCDLICQTGCPRCDQKCSINTNTGTPTCNAPSPELPRNLEEGCTPVSQGSASQTDNCLPGLVCLPSVLCGSRCVKFCRDDGDCGGSGCSRTFPGGVKYCDVPIVTCNPVTPLGTTGCPGAAQGCYLSTTVPDETRCDCTGAVKENGDCSASRNCFPGLVCADPSGQSVFICQRACKLTGTKSGCSNNIETCTPIKGSKTYGFCQPTP
jgi:hypothetical protein